MSFFEPLVTATNNPKHKREVCRYWIKGTCVKGIDCEFLHMWDLTRMPKCHNENCSDTSCPFKHTEKKFICANYEQGFCSFGRNCPHKHVLKEGPPPETASFFTENYEALVYQNDMQQINQNFHKKPCSYYVQTGWCPYFDMCTFHHGPIK